MLFSVFYRYFDQPFVLALIIPLFFALLFLIRKDFVKSADEERRGTVKFWFFLMRFIVMSLLIIAIASPFVLQERLVSGEPSVTILVDNSSSFDVFDRSVGEHLREELKKYVKTDIKTMGAGEKSDLGDRILENLRTGGSILLVSDGYSNEGVELGDVALHATNLNSSINALNVKAVKDDYRVEIRGPGKAIADVDNIFTVNVGGTSKKERHVVVTVDGKSALDKSFYGDARIVQKFSDGYHKIMAQITDSDYFPQNNVFYKTVKVVKKPKVLIVTEKESPLKILVNDLFELDVSSKIDRDLKDYYAVILNDLPLQSINENTVALNEYTSDGNGLVIFGGQASYDRGEYKGSAFERMLPVFVSGTGKQEGDVNIVIVIDISASVQGGGAVDVEKSLAISALRNIRKNDKVGIVAFDTQGRLVSDIDFLFNQNQAEVEGKISSLVSGGGTWIGSGLSKANEMLAKAAGSKNIILVSDGQTQNRAGAYAAAQQSASLGVKIYTLGVGESTDENVMRDLADIGSGSYFRVQEARNVKILFGDPDEENKQKGFGIAIIDKNHFVTEDLTPPEARVFGYNEVIPKSTAKLLVTTTDGHPLISVWRYGLGRVASVSTDDGSAYASELLKRDNSALLIRTMNWAIGDPERKSSSYIDIKDTRIGQNAEIIYKTEKQPVAKDVTFYKVGENLYSASIYMDSTGFKSVLGAEFAVNYPEEYSKIGVNPELNSLVFGTGGKMFDENNIEDMVSAIKEQSKRTSYQKWYYRWHLVLAALALFLFDIFVRKMAKYRQR